jgi:hypothetical protein
VRLPRVGHTVDEVDVQVHEAGEHRPVPRIDERGLGRRRADDPGLDALDQIVGQM